MRALLMLVFAVLAAGCGGTPKEQPQTPVEALRPAAALPVLAPMQARERLLHDLGKQGQKARDRAAQFDEVVGRGSFTASGTQFAP